MAVEVLVVKRSTSAVTSLSTLVIPKEIPDSLEHVSLNNHEASGYFERFSSLYGKGNESFHAVIRFLDSLEGGSRPNTIKSYHTQLMIALTDFFHRAYDLPTPAFDDVAAFLTASELCRNADTLESNGKLSPKLRADIQARLDHCGEDLVLPDRKSNRLPEVRELLPDFNFRRVGGRLKMQLRGEKLPPRRSEINQIDERVVNMILELLEKDKRSIWPHLFQEDIIGNILGVGEHTRKNKAPTLNQRHSALKVFEFYLTRSKQLLNHTRVMPDKPRMSEPLHQAAILTPKQMVKVLDFVVAKSNDTVGDKDWMKVRNHALFAVLDNTLLRAGAICNIQLSDINFENKTLYVPAEKGGKNRILPLNPFAIKAIKAYFCVRKKKLERAGLDPKTSYLFLSKTGEQFYTRALEDVIHFAILAAGIGMPPFGRWGPHSWRHSVADEMYEKSGGDICKVQRALGHQSPKTTQIYVDGGMDRRLANDFSDMHPRANGFEEGKT
jgi:site-specific recombinase XerD